MKNSLPPVSCVRLYACFGRHGGQRDVFEREENIGQMKDKNKNKKWEMSEWEIAALF